MGWRKLQIIAIVFLLQIAPVLAQTEYRYSVQQTGETEVFIQTERTLQIKLPADVTEPFVTEGKLSATALVPTGTATLKYTTSYYTRKQDGVWYFKTEVKSPNTIKLTLPQSVHVVLSEPRAQLEKEENWTLNWQNTSGTIEVAYVRTNQAETSIAPASKSFEFSYSALILILLGFAVIYLATRQRKNKERTKPDLTEGQMNVIRAANPNEATALTLLLRHNGHMKRNILEKESKLSKSSLASTLKNLERKNIVEIDRSFFVHYIKLTDWFKDLK